VQSDIRIISVEPHYTDEVCRTPLKFGAVTVEQLPFCRVKATVENRRGEVAAGWGGIFLMDFWSWPTPELPHEAKSAAMVEINQRCARLAAEAGGWWHPVDLFLHLEDGYREANEAVCRERHLHPAQTFLGALVCASPVDAAIHDAFGNVNGMDTYAGYGPESMEHDLGHVMGPSFAGRYIADFVRDAYLPEIPIFHLVGGLDKLTRGEVEDSDPQDGVPNCLEDWVARDGVFCLKVKLRGTDLAWDVERTLAVHRIGRTQLAKLGIEALHLTADTNEQCASPQYIVEYLHRVRERSPEAYDCILYIEQPTERDLAASRHDMRPIAELKPVLVDESLTDLESYELARELGWSGIALKTCKCHSAALLLAARARADGIPYAVQDLTNPSLALMHSVGFAARLYTIMGVEANSRQFFPDSTTPGEQRVHEGIFRVRRGVARTASLQGTGLGYRVQETGQS